MDKKEENKLIDKKMNYLQFNPDKVLSLLENKGISQRQFCKMYYESKTHGTIDGIINGDIRVSKLVKICNLLDVSIDELFDIEK